VNMLWTWNSLVFISRRKPQEIIVVMVTVTGLKDWIFGEDIFDNSHILAIRKGVNALTATSAI